MSTDIFTGIVFGSNNQRVYSMSTCVIARLETTKSLIQLKRIECLPRARHCCSCFRIF